MNHDSEDKRRFKISIRHFLAMAILIPLGWFVYHFGALVFVIATSPSCRENSEVVRAARALSQERLEQLYLDMERYSLDSETPPWGYGDIHDEPIPAEFLDIGAIKVRPAGSNIMLAGCFDHFVYLRFCGLKESRCRPPGRYIELEYGEFERGTEVLWQDVGASSTSS